MMKTPQRADLWRASKRLCGPLLVAWFCIGVFRALINILLNRYVAFGHYRLISEAFQEAFLAPDFLAISAVSFSLAVAVGAWVWVRTGYPSTEPRTLLLWLMTLILCTPISVLEMMTRTPHRAVISGGLSISSAHTVTLVLLMVVSIAGALLLKGLMQASESRSRWLGFGVPSAVIALILVSSGLSRLSAPEVDRNVLLITIDTLRADHLSSYGYERSTSPSIDRLAEHGVQYRRAFSQAPNTHPSMASLHTSILPTFLGAPLKYIPYQVPTLAEVLRNSGIHSGAVVSNVWLKSELGFDQGFHDYDQTSAMSEFYRDQTRQNWHDASHVTEAALKWLDRHYSTPFFLWLHYLDPHHPYEPPDGHLRYSSRSDATREPWLAELSALPTDQQGRALKAAAEDHSIDARSFGAVIDLYDDEIAFTDFQIGRVLRHLEDLSVTDRTLIVLTADHGEEFRDHGGWGHSHTLFNELLHVPLVLSGPGISASEVSDLEKPVALLDIAPTILDWLGVSRPKTMTGRSLVGAAGSPTRHRAISALTRNRTLSIQDDRWKLIHPLGGSQTVLFDLRTDPEERVDVLVTEQEAAKRLLGELREAVGSDYWLGSRENPEEKLEQALDEKMKRDLEALGYLN